MTALLPASRFVVLTDKHGRFRSIAIVSGAEPEVVPGEHGFLWVDTGVDGTLENPVLKMWDEEAADWQVIAAPPYIDDSPPSNRFVGQIWVDTSS
jgi:hypothetical protein